MNGLRSTRKGRENTPKYRHAKSRMLEVHFPEVFQEVDAEKNTVRPDLA
jgi:hypothetical protein